MRERAADLDVALTVWLVGLVLRIQRSTGGTVNRLSSRSISSIVRLRRSIYRRSRVRARLSVKGSLRRLGLFD